MESSSAAESEEEIPVMLSPPDECLPDVDGARMVQLASNGVLGRSRHATEEMTVTDAVQPDDTKPGCFLAVAPDASNRAKSVEFLCSDDDKALLQVSICASIPIKQLVIQGVYFVMNIQVTFQDVVFDYIRIEYLLLMEYITFSNPADCQHSRVSGSFRGLTQ
jgi:hypothetical protein